MNWNILKIEETKDKKAITRAYRELLAVTNPEEKPEEFKLLREAYEEALRLAEEAEQEENTEKTPVDLWLSRLESVYFDSGKRNSLPAWEELMDDELLMSLDTKPLVEDAMITFFLKNYRVPHKVWLYLNDIFGFMDKLDELYSKYPRGFVDNIIIDGVQYDNFLSFDMFSEDTDGRILDEYIGTYLQIRHDAFDNMTEQIARLKSLPAYHPYVATLILRYDQYKGELGTVEKIESIVEGYPEDIHLLCELLVAYYEADESDKVLELAEKILSLNPDVATALRLKAYTLAKKEEYKEAVEAINKLMDLAGGDQKLLYELDEIRHEWNEKLIEQYASRLENEKDNQELVYDLIWSYILNNMNDKAEELLPLYQENYPTESKYLYVRFILAQDRQQYDEAIGFIDRMLQIEDTGEFGDTEEEKKRKSKVTDLLARKAFILSITGKKEECIEALQYGIEHHGDSPELMTRTYYTYMGLKMYKEAGECAKAVTELRPGSYHGYLLLARAYFEMFRDSEAFEAVNTAIDLDGSDLGAYLLKLRILVRNNAFEPAEQLIQFLEDEGIKDEINVKWCKAQIISERDKDAEKALELYKEVDEEISNMEDPNEKPFWAPSFYFMMTSCLADVKDAKGDYTREDLYALLEKGIAVDPDDFDCLEYKAWLLKKDEKFEESIELYKKLEAMPRTNLYVEKQLADLYYEDVYKDGDKSLRYYEMVAEHEKDSRMYHLNVAYLYFVMKRYEESESHLLRAKEIVPEDPWVLYRFADLYLAQNRLHEALQAAQDAVQLEMKLEKEKRRAYYWIKLSQVQLRMSNPEGALKALFEGKNQAAKFDDYMDKVYDVYLKFGMWDEME
ncbi:MAG: hypothetical protein MJ171_05700, partial [Clostridia bacterium]|nr:hypothetical protein [Clostridia bacterium]